MRRVQKLYSEYAYFFSRLFVGSLYTTLFLAALLVQTPIVRAQVEPELVDRDITIFTYIQAKDKNSAFQIEGVGVEIVTRTQNETKEYSGVSGTAISVPLNRNLTEIVAIRTTLSSVAEETLIIENNILRNGNSVGKLRLRSDHHLGTESICGNINVRVGCYFDIKIGLKDLAQIAESPAEHIDFTISPEVLLVDDLSSSYGYDVAIRQGTPRDINTGTDLSFKPVNNGDWLYSTTPCTNVEMDRVPVGSLSQRYNFSPGGECLSLSGEVERWVAYETYFKNEKVDLGAAGFLKYSKPITVVTPGRLEVEFTDAVTGAVITSPTGQSITLTPLFSEPDGYMPPVTAYFQNLPFVEKIYPGRYNVTVTPPEGYVARISSPLCETPDCAIVGESESVERTLSFSNVKIEDTQLLAATVCPEDAQDCAPKNTFPEAVPADPEQEQQEGEGEVPPEAPALPHCVPPEILSSPWAYLLRIVIDAGCAVADISVEIIFPLFDVALPLRTSDDEGPLLEKRKMFQATPIKMQQQGLGEGGALIGEWISSLYKDTWTPEEVYFLWERSLAIAASGFVLAIVIYAYMIMFRRDVSKYSLKQFLVNTLVGVTLASLSYQISTFMFDATRIVALLIRDGLFSINTPPPHLTFTEWAYASWDAWDYAKASGTGILAGLAGVITGVFLSPAAFLVPCAMCLISYALTLISVVIILLARVLLLYVMVIISPIVFMLMVIPEFSGLGKAWFSSMFRILSMYPLGILIYNLLLVLGAMFYG